MMIDIILPFIYTVFLFVVIYYFAKFFYLNIYANYKTKTGGFDIDDIMEVLRIITQAEIEMYEENIFSKRQALTNTSYENYFKDITNNIINALSPEFFYKSSVYFTEETIIRIITRNVSKYLQEKIKELNIR